MVVGVSDELNKLIDQSNKAVLKLKKGLETLKEENATFAAKNPNSSEARIRENLHAAVTRKFREILKEYQAVQTDFKKDVREKVTRQVKIVFPEANDDEVGRMVADGDAATAQAIRLRMTGINTEISEDWNKVRATVG
ncbi:syntaxin-1A-like [Condylostylus longicornis]|uniref:syntaxin-1A-like n=1 Tax=Condylostylus longicornis TaxID=2530218 RepID=UPI00244DB0A4|nr:syntaxin-1A-like [Condylostylus longicornis]